MLSVRTGNYETAVACCALTVPVFYLHMLLLLVLPSPIHVQVTDWQRAAAK